MADVRAIYCKVAVAAIKRHRHAQAMTRRLEAVRAVVRQAPRAGWVDAEYFAQVADATLTVLGREASQDFWAQRLESAFRYPLMRALLQGGLFLYGNSPSSIIRMTPKAYPLVFRECGAPRTEVGEGRVRLVIEDIPGALRSEGIAHCYAGHCYAALRHTQHDRGEVEVDASGLRERGQLTLTTRWS